MKNLVLLLLVAIGLTSSAFAQQRTIQDRNRFDEELNERDFDALRDFLKQKREVDLKKKAVNLLISGDVRFEWRHLYECLNKRNLRGDRALKNNVPVSRNDFDCECNLRFDYKEERDWAVVHLQYDNSAGVDPSDVPCVLDRHGFRGSGVCDSLCLKKAFMGYRLYHCGSHDLFVELGRRGNLYNVFDSRIQFLSRLDGVYLKYKGSGPDVPDWYWSFAAFVVDERIDHFAFCTEIGFLNVYDSNFDFKYSFIDWVKHGIGRCVKEKVVKEGKHKGEIYHKFVEDPRGFKFLNSQFTVAYHFDAEICNLKGTAFGAFEINHLGHRVKYHKHGHHKHAYNQNKAWYAGFLVGEVEKEGDYSFEVRYEWVQAFSVPDEDASGICNGNVLNQSITQKPNAVGNTNYKGWRFEGLYALTDNITIDTQVEWSYVLDKRITHSHDYSKLEVEAIYAF